jgi:hypothetical protein
MVGLFFSKKGCRRLNRYLQIGSTNSYITSDCEYQYKREAQSW